MHNVGNKDRIIRIIIAALILALNHFDVIKGDLASGLLFVAVVLLITAIKRCSPIYSLLGLGTCGIPNDNKEAQIKPKRLNLK